MGNDDDNNPPYEYEYRRGQFNLNGRIMITAIVCLFVVVIIVIFLHIYARCVLRRQARRRAALGITVRTTTQLNPNQQQQPKRGLSESVIASFPTFVYKSVDHINSTTGVINSIECSVCLSALEDEEIARLLPNCKHTFHAECIDMWLNSHSTCPICRTEAEPPSDPTPGESVVEMGEFGGVGGVPATIATAPPILDQGSTSGTSAKVGRTESSSRMSSFRRILSREKSERRIQQQTDHHHHHHHHALGDMERQ